MKEYIANYFQLRHFQTIVFSRLALPIIVFSSYVVLVGVRNGIQAQMFYLQWIEFIFLIYFYYYFYTILKPTRWRPVMAVAPILIGYIIHDLYYSIFGKILRFVELSELPELLQVITLEQALLIALAFVVPLLIYLYLVNYKRITVIAIGALPIALLVTSIYLSPSVYIDFVQHYGNGIVKYSDTKSVESNGRYTMLFYKEAERQYALNETKQYYDRSQYELDIEKKVANLRSQSNQRNVHLIVLESFLDPRLFSKAVFDKSPVHEEFEVLFGDNIGLSIASVFGGATAQAEFELLCGVPALERVSSIEFNVFTGAPVYCLPGVLNKLGYRTIASNAYKPNFFNTLLAYDGTGFQEKYFPAEFSASMQTYFDVGDVTDEDYMFDEHLLSQNLQFVREAIKDGKPILNYVLTIYGHTPHLINEEKRPQVIQLKSAYADDHLQRSVNQFYYRSAAIANFVKKLVQIDRNSLIILVSDHVPPLRNGPNTYQALAYLNNIADADYHNRLMVVEDGNVKRYSDMRHYNMLELIYNYLSSGRYCQQQNCSFLEDNEPEDQTKLMHEYFRLIAHAVE